MAPDTDNPVRVYIATTILEKHNCRKLAVAAFHNLFAVEECFMVHVQAAYKLHDLVLTNWPQCLLVQHGRVGLGCSISCNKNTEH